MTLRPFAALLALTLVLALPPLALAQDAATTGATATATTTATTTPVDTAVTAAAPDGPDAVSVPPAAAPAEGAPDYTAWNRVAQRAEQALQAGRASDQALLTLRSELADWRDTFSKAKAENQIRITTLKTQISTLGPAPAEGDTEPAILTERRNELTAQLDELEAPVKAAELAYARANALIGELDNTVRARQTDALLSLGPSPLNPGSWPKALSDLRQTLSLALSGVTSSWGTETQRAELRNNLPVTLVLSVIALALLLRGRAWVIHAGARVRSAAEGPAEGVWGFLVSLGQVILPLIGILALTEALHAAGILGLRAQVIVDTLPGFGFFLFFYRWLGNRVFGSAGAPWAVLDLSTTARAEGRFYAGMLGLMLGLAVVLNDLVSYETYSDATKVVLDFPIVAITGFMLYRLGQILRHYARDEAEASEESTGFLARTAGLIGLLLILVGVLGPLAAAVGYNTLASRFVFPSALSLSIVALVMVLHRFFVDLYGLVTRSDEENANNALLPVIASFLVILAVLPVLALVWGARVTDLTELWARAREGIAIGGTVISPADFVTFGIVFVIGFGATRLLQGMLKTTILPKTRMDLGGRNALTSGIGYVGIFLAALAAITAAGINLSSLAIVAGALSVGIGFGLQNIVSNFVSGIILLIERPISEGDWIEVGGQMGTVRDISVRSTRIETFDRTDVILPNSDLISGVVTNYTRGNLIGRVIVQVGVAYGSDTRKVEAILLEVANAHPLVTVNPRPAVIFTGFGADSLDFEIRAILKDVNFKLTVRSDMNHEIARRFVEEGIEIPFAQRDIWIRNPEVLAGAPAKAKPKKPKAAKAKPARPTEAGQAGTRAMLEAGDMHDSSGDGPADQDD